MPFICEGNYYYGFVVAGGKRYSFDLTVSDDLEIGEGSKGLLKVEWRLYRDLGDSLENFLAENRRFVDPQDFYKQFSDFVEKKLNIPRVTKTWLQHPLKIAVLVKCLEQEIEKIEKYIKYLDLETRLVNIEVTDSEFRVHKAVLKLSLNYMIEPVVVVSHDLPQQKIGIENNPNFDNIFTVTEFCEKFLELINYFQHFWNTVTLLDSQCCVLDPVNPSFKDVYRRIKLSDTVSVVLTFNLFWVGQRPKIKLLGCQSDVNYYQTILQNNLEKDLWDNDAELLYNLSNVLEVSIPSKIFDITEGSNFKETGECAICYTWRLADEAPNEMCENLACKSMYHSTCLFTYLSSVPRNRDYFGKIQGECPNCDDIISCTKVNIKF